jgi:hypothetical protein
VHGQRFDLYQPGVHPLIRIPKQPAGRTTAFLVLARATHIGAACSDMYFTEVNITGHWTRRHRTADLTWTAEAVEHEHPKWNKFHDISVKVVRGRTLQGTTYLNVLVRGLNKARLSVGGLLGEDDHTAASTRSDDCRKLVSL